MEPFESCEKILGDPVDIAGIESEARELLPAVDAVLQGRQYLSRRLRPHVISPGGERVDR